MNAFALASEEADDLDRMAPVVAEGVRRAGVELGGFACGQDQLVFAQYEAKSA
ncbi:MAG TPA: hypothetical protein VFH30_10285 [Acidimicrobiales bacterium]|nr:hypothetical protein [Acidimicrobiales bacterium]